MTDVVGRAPSTYERLLIDDASRFAPSASMERLDAHAKFLFATVGTIGVLITGIGLFTPDRPSLWATLPVAIIAGSLACAVWAITPKHYELDISDLSAVRAHYAKLLRRRGGVVRIAGFLFALALVSTPLVFWIGARKTSPVAGGAALKVTRADAGDTASILVELSNVPVGSRVTTTVSRVVQGRTVPISRASEVAGSTVKLELEQPIGLADEVIVTTEVLSKGQDVYRGMVRTAVPVRIPAAKRSLE